MKEPTNDILFNNFEKYEKDKKKFNENGLEVEGSYQKISSSFGETMPEPEPELTELYDDKEMHDLEENLNPIYDNDYIKTGEAEAIEFEEIEIPAEIENIDTQDFMETLTNVTNEQPVQQAIEDIKDAGGEAMVDAVSSGQLTGVQDTSEPDRVEELKAELQGVTGDLQNVNIQSLTEEITGANLSADNSMEMDLGEDMFAEPEVIQDGQNDSFFAKFINILRQEREQAEQLGDLRASNFINGEEPIEPTIPSPPEMPISGDVVGDIEMDILNGEEDILNKYKPKDINEAVNNLGGEKDSFSTFYNNHKDEEGIDEFMNDMFKNIKNPSNKMEMQSVFNNDALESSFNQPAMEDVTLDTKLEEAMPTKDQALNTLQNTTKDIMNRMMDGQEM